MHKDITGLILAGGRSQRMGRDKANMLFHGVPMLQRACDLLHRIRLREVVILGSPDNPTAQDAYPGPARAVFNWLRQQDRPCSILVLPVDMPALDTETLEFLLSNKSGAYFRDCYLPFYAPQPHFPASYRPPERLRDLLSFLRLESLPVPENFRLKLTNVNTPNALKQLEAAIKPVISL
ncbi:molybdenum cofactor guanylyltransferase [Kordiimonas sp.]|uniref:molybdenum cofactor guanylyltransferase n=1 Tax=Kordiimonas sp. TaxID=1970157 RepID=UPI003A92891F